MTYTPIPQGTLNWDAPVNAAFVDQDTRITSNTGNIAANSAAIAALQLNGFMPADHGMLGWTIDPVLAMAGTGLATGVMSFSRIKVPIAGTLSNVMYNTTVASTTPVAGQNFVAVYDAAGNRIAISGDQSTNFSAAIGVKTAPVGPVSITPGSYYIAFLSNAATAPSVSASPTTAGTGLPNVNLTAATGRSMISGAGNTTLPATVTFSSFSVNSVVRWGGIS